MTECSTCAKGYTGRFVAGRTPNTCACAFCGKEYDLPKPTDSQCSAVIPEGFAGHRVRTLYEASDGTHTMRLALYAFDDGSESTYVEACETHDGAGPPRLHALSTAVHCLQNVGEMEVFQIGNRALSAEVKPAPKFRRRHKRGCPASGPDAEHCGGPCNCGAPARRSALADEERGK